MPRGILITKSDKLLSEEELSFYLPKLVKTYTEIAKRRRRRLSFFTTGLISACAAAFMASPDSLIALPIIGAKVNTSIAAAALFTMSVVIAQISVFDWAAGIAYRQEVETLHNIHFGTECPTWYLRPPTVLDTILLLRPKMKRAKILYLLFLAFQVLLIIALLFYFWWNWSLIPFNARLIFIMGTIFLISIAFLLKLLKNYSDELLKTLRH